ncbi:MAG: GH32 C-terminal domain-containing protein [Candidatus Pseudobacter hemicellulosilyticus]|uniref:GH32 C-terminal domain-containing protein n=1 Tax=Candidatus Pseudobacter hemicellulosilyticus TaxID=3121375 RepID=A0AAJ5WS33_9BACT|nr:MAG: GH32 C-terminal domain-containing protein [Pseudobacter sp.]
MHRLQRFAYGIPLLLLSGAAAAQDFNQYFTSEKKFLQLPVKNGAPKRNLEIWKDGVLVRFFDMELAEGKPDWYAYLDISEWNGKKLELRVDKLDRNATAFRPIRQSDLDSNAGKVYAEALRGQIHFSPKRGWTNDPNGMVYYKGQYHLFFQHNPYGRGWGNMTWGHAVSKDMIHWTEVGDAIHPDGFGPMFSGTAVVDSNNTSGFGKDGQAPLVMFFTGARAWCQGLAWSNDGLHFNKLDYAPVPRIHRDNRDPKVFWYGPGKHWVMLFWVELDGGQHTQHFFTSDNLKDWTPASILKGGIGNDRYLFECPDLFELPVDGNPANKKWVISAATSMYAIGSFDGKTFTPEAERLLGQVGRDYYAAQSFNNEPNGRRIEIGWWRTHTDKGDMTFNQSMTIPQELALITTPEGIRMTRTPVKELEALRSKQLLSGTKTLTDKSENPLQGLPTELLELRTTVVPGKAKTVTFNLNGLDIVYDVAAQELSADGVKAKVPLLNGKLPLTIFVDRIGVEIFANNGLIYMPVNKNLDGKGSAIKVSGGKVKFENLSLYQLQSAWQ